MRKIRETQNIVEKVLRNEPETRGNDDLLYLAVCKNIQPTIGTYKFIDVFANRKVFELPPFESVRRARQKLQAKYPECRPSDKVTAERALLETEVRAYAHE